MMPSATTTPINKTWPKRVAPGYGIFGRCTAANLLAVAKADRAGKSVESGFPSLPFPMTSAIVAGF
jgi:hypothetical protein